MARSRPATNSCIASHSRRERWSLMNSMLRSWTSLKRSLSPAAASSEAAWDVGCCVRRARSRSSAASWDSRSEEHTSELQSLMRISYAVFCLKKTKESQNRKQSAAVVHNRINAKCHNKKRIPLTHPPESEYKRLTKHRK